MRDTPYFCLYLAMLTFTYDLVDSAEIPVQEGLVAQWDFDETTGQVARDSKGDLHGDLINFGDEASHWVPGRVGGAISFNGSNHIEVADDPSIWGRYPISDDHHGVVQIQCGPRCRGRW